MALLSVGLFCFMLGYLSAPRAPKLKAPDIKKYMVPEIFTVNYED